MLNVNDFVNIKGTNLNGYIEEITKNNKYIVIINNNKTILTRDNLIKLDIKSDKKLPNVTINFDMNFDKKIEDEIMLRHQCVEEAIYNLDIFFNDAILNNLDKVKIIHGRNGGILRKAVHAYLSSNKNVKSYRLGNYFEGSYGVTIAFLK